MLGEEQNGFRESRSCADGYFNLKLLIEKRKESNKETHLAFIDSDETFDRVDRQKLLEILADDETLNQLIQTVLNGIKNTISVSTGKELYRK